MWQAEHVAAALVAANPGVEVELVLLDTEGDRRLDVPIAEVGGKGVFAKEVQQAVLDGRADLAVHSAKDLPAVTVDGLVLAAVPERGDARDALVTLGLLYEGVGDALSLRRHPRIAARLIVEDIEWTGPGRIVLTLPRRPVMSDLDPDVLGIVCRNLVENALRHGAPDGAVEVSLEDDGTFRVANDGPIVPPEVLDRLTHRFERGPAGNEGSGLGLAIVAGIADRVSSRLALRSPRPGKSSGFEASLVLPAGPP